MTDDDPEGRVALAVAALSEVTDPADIGPLLDVHESAPGVVDLRFATTSSAYPGWQWTVSTAAVEGAAPTVLEVELLPGDGSLLAPSWVPWAERLAEWRKTHPDEQTPASSDDDADDDDDEDLDPDEDVLDDEVDVEDVVDHDEASDEDDASDDGEPSNEERAADERLDDEPAR